MTQMMLFDAPAASPLPASVPVSVPASVPVAEPAARIQPNRAANKAPEHTPGLNHMGDLARLVILRYELAAKRRAEQAARPR
ncbi:hypothetical protein Pla52n_25230 [Stieleria varia]|uniref:Uncharacterized protein n=1 Tax=Stieleria varia TaxID=2528005 RepID=A0A5C6AZB8_9BACT|nr:hypothetical protein Pla52n_25230 [Stieleria varia]